jgi:hypothetical protein
MARVVFGLLILITLTACGSSPSGSGFPDADARATLAVYSEQQERAAVATRQSSDATAAAIVAQMEATAQVEQQATAEAVAIAQAQAATAESLAFLATAQALNFEATEESYAILSTAQAVQQIATAEAAIVADEARRLEIARQAEIAAIERGRLWNTVIYPILAFLLAIPVIGLLATLVYRFYQRSRPYVVHQAGDRPVIIAGSNQPYLLPRITAPEPLALPAGEPVARPSQLPMLQSGHVLIAGETGSGKSTAMKAILSTRQNVTVLDPHDDQQTWSGAEVIGAGRNFQAIAEYMRYMKELLETRYAARANGGNNFPAVTVATDEMPAIVSHVGREIEQVWREWLREGRKVGLFFLVSTQSTRVKTLGIEGERDLLENFAGVLVLGQTAVSEYGDLCRDMERPAVLRTIRGAQPVIVPNVETRPVGQFIAPVPQRMADPDNLTGADRARIRHMLREGYSQAGVEEKVFGYKGGKAWTAVKHIKDELDSARLDTLVLGAT